MNVETPTQAAIVYADQRKRKVFVMTEDRSKVFEPEEVMIADVAGNILSLPTSVKGNMTVIDVAGLKSGGYFIRFLNEASKAVKVILF